MSNNILIPVSKPALIGREKEYVMDCIDSAWISSIGKYVELLERTFTEYLGVKNAISCCNGTAALHLALLALNIGHGDEVIVPTFTYVATANAVKYTGATPIFADIEPDTWNIDPQKIEELLTPNTKAIIPVHLYGHPCDMDPIIEIAEKHNLFVIEDTAQALGAKYKGKLCGNISHISTFSFYGNKIITTGEGGMVVTNNNSLAERVFLLKGQGMDLTRRYWFPVIGYNYRMTNIEAAIGLAQLENIDKFLLKRRIISQWYDEYLKDIDGITLQREKDYAVHSYWMYSILIEKEYGMTRDEVISLLMKHGIETRPFFYPMHILPIHKIQHDAKFTHADSIASKGINLPIFYELKESEIKFIADILKLKY